MSKLFCVFSDREKSLPWSGGVMVMKNGDVYFTTRTTEHDRKIRMEVHDKLVPHVPIKIDGLSGQKISGKSPFRAGRYML